MVLTEQPQLVVSDFVAQGHEDVGRPHIAVILGDLVLEDEMVAERVPCELAGKAMVLVEVGSACA